MSQKVAVETVTPTNSDILLDPQDEDLRERCRISDNSRIPTERRRYWVFVGNRSLSHHLWERITGAKLEAKSIIDHTDRNALNNSRSNLRLASASQNAGNGRRHHDSTSPYKGVSRNHRSKSKPWEASIGVSKLNGKPCNVKLGYYATAEQAARIYNLTAKEWFGEFAHVDEVPDDK